MYIYFQSIFGQSLYIDLYLVIIKALQCEFKFNCKMLTADHDHNTDHDDLTHPYCVDPIIQYP